MLPSLPVYTTEIHYCIDLTQFVIVEHFCTTFYIEMQGFLIYDRQSKKYNLYVMDHYKVPYPMDIDFIIKEVKPTPLEIAQISFPQYRLTEENYGF